MHDALTGSSIISIIYTVTTNPVNWFLKKQATVVTEKYGSEFNAASVCVEQIIHHCRYFCYLGVPA
jgi:hypothetical protein